MRAQQHLALAFDERIDPDGVPHIARGVVVGDADGVEVVGGPLDLGPLEHAEAHLREGLDAVVQRLRHGVETAAGLGPSGQRYVERSVRREGGDGLSTRGLAACGELAFEARLELVQRLAEHGALRGGRIPERAQAEREASVPAAQPAGAPRLAFGLAVRARERLQRFRAERVNLRFESWTSTLPIIGLVKTTGERSPSPLH